jgi:hypothetical protein
LKRLILLQNCKKTFSFAVKYDTLKMLIFSLIPFRVRFAKRRLAHAYRTETAEKPQGHLFDSPAAGRRLETKAPSVFEKE